MDTLLVMPWGHAPGCTGLAQSWEEGGPQRAVEDQNPGLPQAAATPRASRLWFWRQPGSPASLRKGPSYARGHPFQPSGVAPPRGPRELSEARGPGSQTRNGRDHPLTPSPDELWLIQGNLETYWRSRCPKRNPGRPKMGTQEGTTCLSHTRRRHLSVPPAPWKSSMSTSFSYHHG